MLSTLEQGSLVYILDKTDHYKYSTAKVVNITPPELATSGPYVNQYVVNIKIEINGEIRVFGNIPTTATNITYFGGNYIISEHREDIEREVETALAKAEDVISNKDKYENQIIDCKAILKIIDPKYARDASRDEEVKDLKSKVANLDTKMDKILELLNKN